MKSHLLSNLVLCISIAHFAVLAFGASVNHKPSKHGHGHAHGHTHSILVHSLHQNHGNSNRYRSFWGNPTSDVISIGTKLHLTVNVTTLEMHCFESTTFTLNKLHWKVKFCKELAGKDKNRIEDALDAHLIYSFDDSDVHWASDVIAVFQLTITNKKIDGKIVKELKHKYTHDSPQHHVELIDWSALLANCVDDDEFSADVEVFVGPKHSTTIDMSQVAADFRIVVDDVSELGETSSPPVTLQGTAWDVAIKIDEEKVAVFLQRLNLNDFDLHTGIGLDVNEWSWNVTMTLSLLPVTDAKPITKQFTHLFSLDQRWGFSNFLSYKNFTKSYVNNDKATFVVNLEVDPPKPLWQISDELDNFNKLF